MNLHFLLLSYRSGYVPGEMIPFSAKISNSSSTEIKNTTVRIVQAVRNKENPITFQPKINMSFNRWDFMDTLLMDVLGISVKSLKAGFLNQCEMR